MRLKIGFCGFYPHNFKCSRVYVMVDYRVYLLLHARSVFMNYITPHMSYFYSLSSLYLLSISLSLSLLRRQEVTRARTSRSFLFFADSAASVVALPQPIPLGIQHLPLRNNCVAFVATSRRWWCRIVLSFVYICDRSARFTQALLR